MAGYTLAKSFAFLLVFYVSAVRLQSPDCMKLKNEVQRCVQDIRDVKINCNNPQSQQATQCVDAAMKQNPGCTDENSRSLVETEKMILGIFCDPDVKAAMGDTMCGNAIYKALGNMFNTLNNDANADCMKVESDFQSEISSQKPECKQPFGRISQILTDSATCKNRPSVMTTTQGSSANSFVASAFILLTSAIAMMVVSRVL